VRDVIVRVFKQALLFDYEEAIEDLTANVSRSLSGSRKRVEQSLTSSLRITGNRDNLQECIFKSWIEQKSFDTPIEIPKVVRA
jgi:hypothetical protein